MKNKLRHLKKISLICIFSLALSGHAQWETKSNISALKTIASEAELLDGKAFSEAKETARKNGWIVRQENQGGGVMEISHLEENGMPRYRTTFNLDAAKTISTAGIWSGGQTGLNLTGNNVPIGIWDAGAVRSSHREFSGRVSQMDGATSISGHATHVTGTMAATGIEPLAKGMAQQATVLAYDWTNDNAEMANAAANSLLISNHSYGLTVGWHYTGIYWLWFGDIFVNETEDYHFGYYDSNSRAFDQIAFNAPFYLIVRAAGNERSQVGPDPGEEYYYWTGTGWRRTTVSREPDGGADGFDSMDAEALAKNILTVGSVYDIPNGYSGPTDVVMTSYSSFGPTDDGRIKPDIVSNGVGVYSSSSAADDSYAQMGGTSQAAPTVSGSLALLQEHFKNLHGGTPMLSATLKGLVAHSADEAGTFPGPDYKFGWGLLNTQKAASVISDEEDGWDNHLILEENLQSGDTAVYQILANGMVPLIATLCWTDPAGTPGPIALNARTRMLVNDLDMRIIGESDTHLPFILDPDQPDSPAGNGDNDRDNIEKIYVASLLPGVYTIIISHKGILENNQQNFSLIVSGATYTRELTLLQPNGGESLIAGVETIISWSAMNLTGDVNLEYSVNDGASWNLIAENVPNLGSCQWVVPNTPSELCKVRVRSVLHPEIYDESETVFKLDGLSPVSNFTIQNNLNRLTLNWDSVEGALRYNVYRETDPLFSPGSINLYMTTADTFFNDMDDDAANNIIGDVSQNYFYIVRAANNGAESINSVRLGEYDFSLFANAQSGLNPISFCLWNGSIVSAAQLFSATPNCISVAVWDVGRQEYTRFNPGLPQNNFSIQEGYPYFIQVSENTVMTIVGEYADPIFNLRTTNGTNFNVITLPINSIGFSDAEDLMSSVPNCNSVAFWNATTQRFEQFSPLFPQTNFAIKAGMPYYVNITAEANWP